MKKAFLVGFTPLTRVIVDVPEGYEASLDDNETTKNIIEAARDQILAYANQKLDPELDLEHFDFLEEDTEVPYDADKD